MTNKTEIVVAREYYALTEARKSNDVKKKRLLSEIGELDGQYEREDKRARQVALNRCDDDDHASYLALTELKGKYVWQGEPSIDRRRREIEKKIETQNKFMTSVGHADENPFHTAGKAEQLRAKCQASLAKLHKQRQELPHPRPLFVVPPVTLPLLFHPNRENSVLETGTLNADVWQFILSLRPLIDRPILRVMRLSCISMAILVHGMPPEITGYLLCV